jgi:hypothetical protein
VRIDAFLKSIETIPNSWVRLNSANETRSGLELIFSVHSGERGRRLQAWAISCLEVREKHLTDFDGGGLRIYSSSHPAAGQYLAQQAELRWRGNDRAAEILGALYTAHLQAVADWIPFDRYTVTRYTLVRITSAKRPVIRGPAFLLRAYAKALRNHADDVKLVLRPKLAGKSAGLKVLHFGESYVVAESFTARPETGPD